MGGAALRSLQLAVPTQRERERESFSPHSGAFVFFFRFRFSCDLSAFAPLSAARASFYRRAFGGVGRWSTASGAASFFPLQLEAEGFSGWGPSMMHDELAK